MGSAASPSRLESASSDYFLLSKYAWLKRVECKGVGVRCEGTQSEESGIL
jgi:hypothetical protein